jgi:hypothetical protein
MALPILNCDSLTSLSAQLRLRCTALAVEAVDHKAQARRALDMVRAYT